MAPSWAIPKGFPGGGETRLAIQTEDHPAAYLDWEGEIKDGYGAGIVKIWERGELFIEARTPTSVKFRVAEGKLKGRWRLWQWEGKKWLLRRR